MDINDQIRYHKQLSADIDRLEAEKRQLGAAIVNALFDAGETAYAIPDELAVSIQNKVTNTIDAAILVGFGVDPDIIKKATKTSTSDAFPVVRLIGAAAEQAKAAKAVAAAAAKP